MEKSWCIQSGAKEFIPLLFHAVCARQPFTMESRTLFEFETKDYLGGCSWYYIGKGPDISINSIVIRLPIFLLRWDPDRYPNLLIDNICRTITHEYIHAEATKAFGQYTSAIKNREWPIKHMDL
jgi:hypothetical protein